MSSPPPLGHVFDNPALNRALAAVQAGDYDSAQRLLRDGGAVEPLAALTLVFRLYQTEIETQAEQLRESQRRTEQALDWFTTLFRSLPMEAVLLDVQGHIVDANEQALDNLALRDVLGMLSTPLRRLIAGSEDELRLAEALGALGDGRPRAIEGVALRCFDGGERWADLRLTGLPPRDDPGDDPGDDRGASRPVVLCLFADRTAQMAARHAQDDAADADRRREMAETASRTKSELLSRVSHELRTPLNAVIGFTELLLARETLDGDARRMLGHVHSAGRHVLELVNEMLLVNRAERGAIELMPAPLALRPLLEDAVALQQVAADALGVSLAVEPAPVVSAVEPLAWADGTRTREVIDNLLSNAVKYNRRAGQVTLRLRHDEAAMHVDVEDTGIGLTTQQQAHLFEPFNRLGADALGVQGSGLGLSIARAFAQAMGGAIAVRSVAGEGSCFTLTLPRAR